HDALPILGKLLNSEGNSLFPEQKSACTSDFKSENCLSRAQALSGNGLVLTGTPWELSALSGCVRAVRQRCWQEMPKMLRREVTGPRGPPGEIPVIRGKIRQFRDWIQAVGCSPACPRPSG